MQKPRLIYYNDAHHFHGKRIEPPVSIHMLQWPVDEVAGTGVDLLVLGLGYGDVYFHNSKVGRVIGQKKEVWENYIDCHAHGGGGSETRYRSCASINRTRCGRPTLSTSRCIEVFNTWW